MLRLTSGGCRRVIGVPRDAGLPSSVGRGASDRSGKPAVEDLRQDWWDWGLMLPRAVCLLNGSGFNRPAQLRRSGWPQRTQMRESTGDSTEWESQWTGPPRSRQPQHGRQRRWWDPATARTTVPVAVGLWWGPGGSRPPPQPADARLQLWRPIACGRDDRLDCCVSDLSGSEAGLAPIVDGGRVRRFEPLALLLSNKPSTSDNLGCWPCWRPLPTQPEQSASRRGELIPTCSSICQGRVVASSCGHFGLRPFSLVFLLTSPSLPLLLPQDCLLLVVDGILMCVSGSSAGWHFFQPRL